jgi:Gly-Xaa carboxypeptidase
MATRDEKDILTTPFVQAPRYQRSKLKALGLVALLASVFAVLFLYADILYDKFLSATLSNHNEVAKLCHQSDVLYPESHAELWKNLGNDYDGDAFLTRAVEWLGGAVRIPYVITYASCRATFF